MEDIHSEDSIEGYLIGTFLVYDYFGNLYVLIGQGIEIYLYGFLVSHIFCFTLLFITFESSKKEAENRPLLPH